MKVDYYDHEIISHFAEKFLKYEMVDNHIKSINNIINGDSSNDYSANKGDKYENFNMPAQVYGDYSLFFLRDETLFEWREYSGELIKVSKNLSPEFAREAIFDYVKLKNNESEVIYEEDITIFSELSDDPLENIEATSKNCLLTLVLAVVYILNFLFVFPQNNFFDLKSSFSSRFDLVDEIQKDNTSPSKIESLRNLFINNILKYIYDSNINTNNIKNSTMGVAEKSLTDLLNAQVPVVVTDQSYFNSLLADDKGISYFLNNENIYSGMLINFKLYTVKNATTINGNVYPFVPDSTVGYFDIVQNDRDQAFLTFDKAYTKNTLYPNTFEYYLRPSLVDNQVKQDIQQVTEIFTDTLYEFSYSIMLYNVDFNIVIVYSVKLEFNSFGNIDKTVLYQGLLPFVMKDGGTFILVIVFNIIIIIAVIYLGLGNISSFSNSIFETINSKRNNLRLYEFFDFGVLLLIIVSQLLFATIFIFSGTDFPLKCSTKDDFIIWLNKLITMTSYQNLSGVCIFLLVLRLLKYLMVAFPSFGIVYQTLKFAYKEIFAFFMLVCLMLIGIGSMAHSAFGYYSPYYKDLTKAFFNVYLLFVGIFKFDQIFDEKYSNPIAPYFFVIFMIIFNLILINLFICIILSNYQEVKEKFQKFNDVYSMLVQEKLQEITIKFYNLLIFKHPQEVEMENNKNNKPEKNEEEELNAKNQENAAGGENQPNANKIKPLSDISLFEIFKYNFYRLNLKKLLFGDGWDKVEFNNKKKEMLKKMEEKNLMETIDQYSLDYDMEFIQLGNTIFFIIYIILFIFMMIFQLRIDKPEMVSSYMRRLYEIKMMDETFLNLNQTEDNIRNFIAGFYDYPQNSQYQNIPVNETNYCNYDINVLSAEKFILLNPTYFRITFRLYHITENTDTWTNNYFPVKKLNIERLDFNTCPSSNEFKNNIMIKNNLFKYNGQDKFRTAGDCGGYVINIANTNPDCGLEPNLPDILDEFIIKRQNLGSIFVETIFFNLYEEYAAFIRFNFVKTAIGSIDKNMQVEVVPINRYITKNDFIRTVLECLFLIYSFFYLFQILSGILGHFVDFYAKDFESDPNKHFFKESLILNKFLRIDFKKFKNESLVKSIFDMLKVIITRILTSVLWLVQSLYKYLTSDIYNVLDFIFILLTLSMIFQWYNILYVTNTLNFTYSTSSVDYDVNTSSNINIASMLLEKYEKYYFFQALNGFILFIRLLRFFKFSKSINNIILVIKKARSTIIFHIISMIFFNFGFCLAGFCLFSQNLKEFSNISGSFVQILIMIAGNIDYTIFNEVDSAFSLIFVIIITFSNYLILLNVLIAIIVHSFFDVKNENKINFSTDIEENFFTQIFKICYKKVRMTILTISKYYLNLQKYSKLAEITILQFNKEILNMEKVKKENKEASNNKIGYYDVRNFFSENFF